MHSRPFPRILIAAIFCCASVGAAAQSQSGFGKFLNKVNDGLHGVNQALSGNSNGAANGNAKRMPVGRSAPTGIPVQVAGSTGNAVSDDAPFVRFLQGSTRENVALFNEALPVIDKTIGIISCIRYKQAQGDEWFPVTRYVVDGRKDHIAGYLYGTPMAQLSYHDEHLCLVVNEAAISIAAANALKVEIKFLATDSGETTRYSYLYQKNYRGIWQLHSYTRLSN